MQKPNVILETGLGLIIISALLGAIVFTPPAAQALPSQAVTSAVLAAVATDAPPPELPPAPPPPVVEPAGTGRLAGYVLTAMLEWTKGRDAAPATHKAEIARDIAMVALSEPRAWDKSDGSREALVLASIAFFEGRYRDYLEQCNDSAWVKTKEARALFLLGDCDGGLSGYAQAVGIFQVHYECGAIVLYEDGSWQNACSPASATRLHWRITKASAIGSRRDQTRVALAMARQSIRAGAGLRNYVGGEGPERSRMASHRLDLALAWARLHPFSP